MYFRLLQYDDKKQYLSLINIFTLPDQIKEISQDDFVGWLHLCNMNYSYIYVLMVGDEMVGTGKLMVEYKFSRGLSKVGHIEDIVVGKDYRGNGYGKMIVKYLIEQARKNGCYKVILNSDEDKVEFYNKCAKDLKINYDYGIKYYL